MHKLLFFLICLISLKSSAQTKKVFFSFAPGVTIGGPSISLKQQMIRQGYDQTSSYNFFGWQGTTKYPRIDKFASLLLRGGYLINDRKSIYFVAGLSMKGSVTGFKNEGYADLWIFGGGSIGPMPKVSYEVFQLTAGYLFASQNSRAKLGIGPSLYFLRYSVNSEKSRLNVVPGVALTGRFPLGKEKRVFGMELIVETNLAPPAKMRSGGILNEKGFRPGKANMICMNVGLGFTIRTK